MLVTNEHQQHKDNNEKKKYNVNVSSVNRKDFHHIWNVPNALTMTRVALSGPLAFAIYEGHYKLAFFGTL